MAVAMVWLPWLAVQAQTAEGGAGWPPELEARLRWPDRDEIIRIGRKQFAWQPRLSARLLDAQLYPKYGAKFRLELKNEEAYPVDVFLNYRRRDTQYILRARSRDVEGPFRIHMHTGIHLNYGPGGPSVGPVTRIERNGIHIVESKPNPPTVSSTAGMKLVGLSAEGKVITYEVPPPGEDYVFANNIWSSRGCAYDEIHGCTLPEGEYVVDIPPFEVLVCKCGEPRSNENSAIVRGAIVKCR